MKKVTINDSEKKIYNEDIIILENLFNIKLPTSLKKLYLKYNGGEIVFSDSYVFDFASIKYGEFTIEELFKNLKVEEDIIPASYLPFAISSVGHIITIYIGKENNGIFLFRHDELEPEIIADSLEALLGVKSIDEL